MSIDVGFQNEIWSGADDPTDALITDFLPGADLTIDPLEGLKFGFFFADKSQPTGFEIKVTLEGGLSTETVPITN